MFHPSRAPKRPALIGSAPLLAVLLVPALVAGLSARPQDRGPQKAITSLKAAAPAGAATFNATPATVHIQPSLPAAISSASGAGGVQIAQPQADAVDYVVIRAEFDSAASRARLNLPGFTVLTAFDRFVDFFVSTKTDDNTFNQFQRAPGLKFWEFGGQVQLPPPPTFRQAAPTRAVPEQIVRGGLDGLTGKGVIVVVIDSGIDYRNPDFVDMSSGRPVSRLLYFWDSFSTAYESGLGNKGPYSYPNGRSVGTLYSRLQLTADLTSPTRRIPATDEHGHGTAAAGIAAGNGNNSGGKYAGVAKDADIIGIRLGGSRGAIENEYLLNAAIAWVDSVAKQQGKPVVFSCSFGGQGGAHDGSSIEERELSARFAANTPGRAIVIAAGNEQGSGMHSRQVFRGSDHAALFAWGPLDPNQTEGQGAVILYLHTQNGGTPDLSKLQWSAIKFQDTGQTLPMPTLPKDGSTVSQINGDLILGLSKTEGWAGFFMWTSTGEPVVADAYVYTLSESKNRVGFFKDIRSDDEMIGNPGTTPSAITVGSYDWNDQFLSQGKSYTWTGSCGEDPMHISDLSCYSNVGYSRSGAVKPEVVAPGEWYTSDWAKDPSGAGVKPVTGNNALHIETSGNYVIFNGTSAATPYVAGVVALMLQKKPTLTSGEIKALLERNATQDSFTGQVPNVKWGYGKLDIAAVRAVLNAIR
ncbi:MAG TPA: S8 family serine peptidase [Methylomirabilota bacterium]|nr:S8 family serine peptidase [Methylomirabilota bacterium]